MILRVRYHRTRSPQYVTAVEWVNPANGNQRWLDYDASSRLKTDTTRSRSGKAIAPMSMRTLTVTYDSKTWSVSIAGVACGGRPCPAPPDPNAACNCDLDPFTNFGTEPRVSLLGQQTMDQPLHLPAGSLEARCPRDLLHQEADVHGYQRLHVAPTHQRQPRRTHSRDSPRVQTQQPEPVRWMESRLRQFGNDARRLVPYGGGTGPLTAL